MSTTSPDNATAKSAELAGLELGLESGTEAARSQAAVADDVLFSRYCRGDEAAFEALYEQHRGPVYRYFLRQVSSAVAQDLCQETWVKLIKAAPKYEPRGSFRAYLFKLAHNQLMDHFRIEGRRSLHLVQTAEEVDVDGGVQPDNRYGQDELGARLRDEIARLPIEQRSVWLIKQEGGLDHKSIAAITGISVEGVKSRLRYANDKLKAGLMRYVRS